MAFNAAVVTVGTDPTRLDYETPSDSVSGTAVAINNTGSITVYLGGDDVDTTDGYPLAAGEQISFDLDGGEMLYGVAASETTVSRLAGGV